MTVAVAESATPFPTWPPPGDPHPHTPAAQPLGLCYHGNFSLSFLNDESDVGDDVVDANDIRSILELAEQCAVGISVKSGSELDMHPKDMSPPQSPCEELSATFQPCRFKAGVKRKLDFDDWDGASVTAAGSPGYDGDDAAGNRDGDGDGDGGSEYRDRQKMLEVSLCKMRRMEDPETSLRRCVLINNMTVQLRRELDRPDQQGRTVQLPKKRHSLRRVEAGTAPVLVGVGTGSAEQTPAGFRLMNGGPGHCSGAIGGSSSSSSSSSNAFPVKRRLDGAGEKAGQHYGPCPVPEHAGGGDRPGRDGSVHGCHGAAGARSTDTVRCVDPAGDVEDETPSIFGDIDNVFQSLLSCLGDPL